MVPGFSQVRALRAWAGVRPLYEEGGAAQGREAKRTFAVLDHAQRDGVGGLVTVVGGKFTTYRLMAERAADVVCAAARRDQALRHRRLSFVLPRRARAADRRPKARTGLGHRLEDRRDVDRRAPDPLICECEIVTRSEFEQAAASRTPTWWRRGSWTTCAAICGWAWGRARAASAATAPPASCTSHPGSGCRAGHGGPGRLRAAALEGPAAAAVGTEPAPGAAGRADLPRHSGAGSAGGRSHSWKTFWSLARGRPDCWLRGLRTGVAPRCACWRAASARRTSSPGWIQVLDARRPGCGPSLESWIAVHTGASLRLGRAGCVAGGLAALRRSARGPG